MSLQSQLTRLAQNVGALTADTNAIFEALRAKGVAVPVNAQLSDVAEMIESIVPPQTYVTIGGRQYKTVTIGNQEWLAENLDYKFSYNGSTLPIGGSATTTPRAWYYSNNEASYGIDGTYKCGLLYNWYATKYLDDNKSTLLPNGWHIPTTIEWDTLTTSIGGASNATKLKSLDNSVIQGFPSEWNGTDDYGFNLLPSGNYSGPFNYFGKYAFLWSKTEIDSSQSSSIYCGVNNNINTNDPAGKFCGFSLRLVKDVT